MHVAIIGGGICGLYLAWKLSERGHSVTVFERKKEIGKKTCSGLFSPRIFDFVPQSKEIVQNKIDYAYLYFPKKKITLNFSYPFLVISHYHLDRIVASLARKAGSEIMLSNRVEELPEGYDRVIGCDGALSKVRENLRLKKPSLRLGIQGFTAQEDFSNYVEVWPTEFGFQWRIPRGEEVEYGIIEKKEKANDSFEEFIKKQEAKIGDKRSALIPQGLVVPSRSDITLCGDAAGLTKPWSGGGVIWGLKAADMLLDTFPDFLDYNKKLKRFFGPRLFFFNLATKLVYFLGFKAFWFLPKNVKIENDFLLNI